MVVSQLVTCGSTYCGWGPFTRETSACLYNTLPLSAEAKASRSPASRRIVPTALLQVGHGRHQCCVYSTSIVWYSKLRLILRMRDVL